MRLRWWSGGDEDDTVSSLPDAYMDGYRAGFIDAEKAAARRARGPNLARRPGGLPVTVAEIVDRLRTTDGAV